VPLFVLCFAPSLCQTFCLLRHPLLPRRHRRSASPTTALAFDQLLAFRHAQPPPHCRLQQPAAFTSHFDIATAPTRQVSTPHTSIFGFPCHHPTPRVLVHTRARPLLPQEQQTPDSLARSSRPGFLHHVEEGLPRLLVNPRQQRSEWYCLLRCCYPDMRYMPTYCCGEGAENIFYRAETAPLNLSFLHRRWSICWTSS
jgi:hypothetical protein